MCITCPTERIYIYISCSYSFCISLSDCTIHSSSPSEDKKFFSLRNVQLGSGATQPLFEGYRGSSLVLNWPGSEVNRSPPSSTDFKHEWSCTSAPSVCFHSVDRENFTSMCQTCSPVATIVYIVQTVIIWCFNTD